MPYVPSATDETTPLDGEKAGTAPSEFRALKQYIKNSLAKLAGATFTGAVQFPSFGVGVAAGTDLGKIHGTLGDVIFDATGCRVTFTRNDANYVSLTGAAAQWHLEINGNSRLIGYADGRINVPGQLQQAGLGVATENWVTNQFASRTNGFGSRYVSTSAPTGGIDGDVWYQVA